LEGNAYVIALNASESPQQVEVAYESEKSPQAVFGEVSEVSVNNGRLKFRIPPRSGVVLK
jgi:hypothetical protein